MLEFIAIKNLYNLFITGEEEYIFKRTIKNELK